MIRSRQGSPLSRVLDLAVVHLESCGGEACLARLTPELDRLYDAYDASEQTAEFKRQCREHDVFRLFQLDPYTHRSTSKPRGYAGDAVMLDYVYSQQCPPQVDPIGADVFAGTTGLSTGQSVRHRRDLIAARIIRRWQEDPARTFASIACGHLREAQAAFSRIRAPFARFTAMDQDSASLEVVSREQSASGVVVHEASVEKLIRGGYRLDPHDLIYSLGLFDYLSDRLARSLTRRLFQSIHPGGELVIANFAPDTFGRGYLAGFMDWDLRLRDEEDMRRLAKGLSARVFLERDPEGNIVFLTLRAEPSGRRGEA